MKNKAKKKQQNFRPTFKNILFMHAFYDPSKKRHCCVFMLYTMRMKKIMKTIFFSGDGACDKYKIVVTKQPVVWQKQTNCSISSMY